LCRRDARFAGWTLGGCFGCGHDSISIIATVVREEKRTRIYTEVVETQRSQKKRKADSSLRSE
jgi:hypothetical protein